MNLLEQKNLYHVVGRYMWLEDALFLPYSAAYVEFHCEAKKITAQITSTGFFEDDNFASWLGVFIDDMETPVSRIMIETGTKDYVLFESDEARKITVRLMKYSEVAFADLGFVSIDVDGMVLPYEDKGRKLVEIVGDSITCGYGNEGVAEKDPFTTGNENPWMAYSGRLSRKLDVDLSLLSWSGNGIISHYLGEYSEEPRLENFLVPALYPYAGADLEFRRGKREYQAWDFSRQADLIIINLGTNDSSFTREIEERSKWFEDKYVEFLQVIREKNPNAKILCILGAMEECLHENVRLAVERRNEMGDAKVYYLYMPLQLEEDGFAVDFHPTMITHEKMAQRLADFILEKGLLAEE